MSLPTGYIALEYIQSSGTEYINTGFAPNQDTRVVMDAQLLSTDSYPAFYGSRKADTLMFWLFASKANLVCFSYGSNKPTATCAMADRLLTDANKNVLSVDGAETITATAATFTGAVAMYLFAANNNGALQYPATMRLYSCEIYDNDTLVRDYVPAKTAEGEVGLYEKVTKSFYANAGTGTFTAGAEISRGPSAPEGFAAAIENDTALTLSWSAVDDATGYRLYRDGELVADTTLTSWAGTVVPFEITEFSLTAYNDDGESDAAVLNVQSLPADPVLWLITDRTAADVTRVETLAAKGWAKLTDAEKAEWNAGMKGAYNASDMNRVGAAVKYVARQLRVMGYAASIDGRTDWTQSDAPTVPDLDAYLADIAALRDVIAVMQTTPSAPELGDGLNYSKDNAIEQILLDFDTLISSIPKNHYYSGDLYAGEI